MASTLTLNNNLTEASEVKLTIFNRRGESFAPPPITLRPNSVERVSLKSLTEVARGDFSSGSIQVFYRGVSMAVTSQVSVTSDRQRISFESPETSMMDYSSAHLDGIVWAPDRDTRPNVALTNTTDGRLTVTITAAQRQDRKLEPVILGPHETRVIDLEEILVPVDVEGGQVVWFEEQTGSLIARAEVADVAAGVSASFSCPGACQCPPSFNSMCLIPSSSVGPIGGASRTLGSTERGLPASVNLVNGEYVNGNLLLNRVNGTDRGTTFRFSNGGRTRISSCTLTSESLLQGKDSSLIRRNVATPYNPTIISWLYQ